jgi:hypothetical protein
VISGDLPAFSLAVVGVDYLNADKAKSNRRFEIALCAPGEPVELRLEPKNRFDERAVGVFSVRGTQLGYLTAERCGRIGAIIRNGREVQAVFQAATPFGAWIRVAFDGAFPMVPEDAAEAAIDGATEAESGDGFFPDEVFPDD